ncbi:MAG TPA: hypothetical protein PK006_01740 [Saprospiraceae bacterium]|nr:hypothetical protein [Saprospiraceae bacterium]
MNPRVKGLLWISLHIGVLALLAGLWMLSIKNQRAQFSNHLEVQIIKSNPENSLITKNEIMTHLKYFFKKDWRKIRQYNLHTKELEDYFEKLSTVHHAEIYMDARDNFHIDIYQRDPVMRVIDIANNQFYIGSDGEKIPCSTIYSARVPVITGLIPELVGSSIWSKSNMAYQTMFKLSTEVSKDAFAKALIEQIEVNQSGQIQLIPKVGKEKINFGAVVQVKEKLEKLKFFYEQGLPYAGWNVYETIDLNNDGQVVCKKYQQAI